jgi:hypothetical protein
LCSVVFLGLEKVWLFRSRRCRAMTAISSICSSQPSDVTIVHVRGCDPALIVLRPAHTGEHRINRYKAVGFNNPVSWALHAQ